MNSDTIQRFIFENENIRGEIVHLHTTYQQIINQRAYPPMVRYLLGEALVSTLLLTSSIKFEGTLSLQFQGTKPLTLLLVQADHQLNVRAMAKYEENEIHEDKDYAKAFLKGQMSITIQFDQHAKTYQSIVPLLSTSMSENLTHYFTQSEQVATRIWMACNDKQAAGMLLQLMPGDTSEEREHFWEYASAMGETVSEEELLHLDNVTLLHRLYHETNIRIFEPRTTQYQCRCSEERMKQLLMTLGKSEVESLLEKQEFVEISCEFCNQHYRFDSIDIAMLFQYKDSSE